MISLVFSIIGALIATGVSFATVAKMRKANAGTASVELSSFDAESDALTKETQTALTYISQMESLVASRELMEQIARTNNDLAEERAKLQQLEKQLAQAQAKVDREEGEHASLKRGKEECQRLADDMRGNAERLLQEQSRLDSELAQSSAQMSMLADEAELTTEQMETVKKINDALADATNQLKRVGDMYRVSSERFLNLEVQYSELEKEYRKLVEKELSGK